MHTVVPQSQGCSSTGPKLQHFGAARRLVRTCVILEAMLFRTWRGPDRLPAPLLQARAEGLAEQQRQQREQEDGLLNESAALQASLKVRSSCSDAAVRRVAVTCWVSAQQQDISQPPRSRAVRLVCVQRQSKHSDIMHHRCNCRGSRMRRTRGGGWRRAPGGRCRCLRCGRCWTAAGAAAAAPAPSASTSQCQSSWRNDYDLTRC
jgi:hypothetical protein